MKSALSRLRQKHVNEENITVTLIFDAQWFEIKPNFLNSRAMNATTKMVCFSPIDIKKKRWFLIILFDSTFQFPLVKLTIASYQNSGSKAI